MQQIAFISCVEFHHSWLHRRRMCGEVCWPGARQRPGSRDPLSSGLTQIVPGWSKSLMLVSVLTTYSVYTAFCPMILPIGCVGARSTDGDWQWSVCTGGWAHRTTLNGDDISKVHHKILFLSSHFTVYWRHHVYMLLCVLFFQISACCSTW